MRAVKIHPHEAFEKYKDQDKRDYFSVPQRVKILEQLEHRHHLAVEAGGPDALAAYGLPWVNYDRVGEDGFKPDRDADRLAIHYLRRRYGEDCSLISGDRGAGKTWMSAYFAYRFYIIGYQVISNISLDFGYSMIDGSDILGIIRTPKNFIWIVDEIHQALNRFRQGANFQRGVIGAFAGLRKNQSCMFGITSQDWQLGMDIKSQFKWAFYPFKRPPSPSDPQWMKARRTPSYVRTQAWRMGPWPEEWRGSTLADKLNLPYVRGAKPVRSRYQPSPIETLLYIGALYGSWGGLPTVKQSGGALMKADVDNINTDEDITLYSSRDEFYAGVGEKAAISDMMPEAELLQLFAQHAVQAFPDVQEIGRADLIRRVVVTSRVQFDQREILNTLKTYYGDRQKINVQHLREVLL